MRNQFSLISLVLSGFLFIRCSTNPVNVPPSEFTKADSLTDYYLSLQDSLHSVWNEMIYHDNQKMDAMHSLVHELMVSHPEQAEYFTGIEERLAQLLRMRYTQKSLANEDVIAEYDFATNELVSELITTAQGAREYMYNKTLQKLVKIIRDSGEKTLFYRNEYDTMVGAYNLFVENYRDSIGQTDEGMKLEKKPGFHLVSEY